MKLTLKLRPRNTRWQIDDQSHQEAFAALAGATSATADQVKALKALGCDVETILDHGATQTKVEL